MKRKRISYALAALLLCSAFGGCDPSASGGSGVGDGAGSEEQTASSVLENENGESVENGASDSAEAETVKRYWRDTVNFGIHVTDDGVMMLGEEKLYEAGVNCYNLFNQCFSDGYSAEKAKATLDILAYHGVKAVRFNCGGYSHGYIDDYFANKQAYLRLLTEIAEYAETLEIGLIPSFFWLYHAVPDHFDEPLRSWGREGSETVGFLRDYTEEIVRALKDHKAVFAWEFGNEFNLACDLPNAADHMPALPKHSKREKRTLEEDKLSATDVNFALEQFTATVLSVDDTGRLITSGNATLRPSQYNQLHYDTWAQDTRAEYATITAMYAPDGVEAVSEHVYFTSQKTFGEELSLSQYLAAATATAKSLKKAYFVGEWGGGSENDPEYYGAIGNAFVDAGVQLVLLWNFNAVEGSVEYSFSADTTRGKMLLSVLADMNAAYEAKY